MHDMPRILAFPLEQPLWVVFGFTFRRPKGHTRKDGTLRKSAPLWPAVRPDTTKLVRAVEDALTGIVWADDALIVDQQACKTYVGESWMQKIVHKQFFMDEPGCRVSFGLME